MRAPLPRPGRRCLWSLALAAAAALAGCGPPATLKKRSGYWADQSVQASAYNHRVRFLVLHYTSDRAGRALTVLTGPHVSVHYLVGPEPTTRDGAPIVRQLLPEDERAWHAGASSWAGRHHINDTSIGIEIVNLGPIDTPGEPRRWQPYTDAQIRAVIALAHDIVTRYDIKPANVVGHSDIAPQRKIDPGPAFPWHRLYRAGIGAWPNPERVALYARRFADHAPPVAQIQSRLADYGYDLPVSGRLDARTHAVLRAFQMHFRPSGVNGIPDTQTLARLWALDAQYR
ncbi:N-acetylmuramoyl-L-alanine amidase [Salinisphaera sp. LB1]|uniref:N-acetylmuramoyl-L-alanine amidase n=1 Tax=Salinisphaera sp. LB1 TaxID=2183911 RepID=UPI000D7060ED|nr:N-acetylmuramoyl-L-alanine amidase [Salinisphaera sp. LB1]AWN17331.1 N-acetylmuramoyl-L-alanine amidase [Salinisphaera sp. LB1]